MPGYKMGHCISLLKKLSQQIRPPPSPHPPPSPPTTLTNLPPEIRLEIYRYLLTTRTTIKKPGDLVRCEIHHGADGGESPCLHTAILRVSKRIYTEALPVLYSENVFAFWSPEDMMAFRTEGLISCTLRSKKLGIIRHCEGEVWLTNISPGFTGLIDSLKSIDRLTYIRHVELYLWHDDHHSPLWSKREKWRRFVNTRSGERAIEIPAVSDLVLDFGAMELEAGNFGVSLRS